MKKQLSILFLGKENDLYVEKALKFCELNFKVHSYLSEWGKCLPKDIGWWEGDYIVSYLSRWVLPAYLLKRAKVASINFHPAPTEYPGVGCNNFALYESAKEYGVTCHHMLPLVDTGKIIAVKRFPLLETDTVATLLSRTYDYQLVLFYEIMNIILERKKLPVSKESWSRKPFTRKKLNQLGQISPHMDKDEIVKRIRATTFGTWNPTVNLEGFIFELKKDMPPS